jgi:hypothetical protein
MPDHVTRCDISRCFTDTEAENLTAVKLPLYSITQAAGQTHIQKSDCSIKMEEGGRDELCERMQFPNSTDPIEVLYMQLLLCIMSTSHSPGQRSAVTLNQAALNGRRPNWTIIIIIIIIITCTSESSSKFDIDDWMWVTDTHGCRTMAPHS